MKSSGRSRTADRAGAKGVETRFSRRLGAYLFLISIALLAGACAELEKPKGDTLLAEATPPRKQEFRWSNGKMPKSFDPALAAAPPETDIVRAAFDGLTDLDPKTLKEVPALAERWEASDDSKSWTFYLREDAQWSNGEPITAKDFVRSWERLAAMGDRAAYAYLLNNIQGTGKRRPTASPSPTSVPEILSNQAANRQMPVLAEPIRPQVQAEKQRSDSETTAPPVGVHLQREKPENEQAKTEKAGIEAVSDHVLKVTLVNADPDFPKLVANPIFRPVYGDGSDLAGGLNANIVTSGAFRIAGVGADGVVLERSDKYWNRDAVSLERVRIVPHDNAEAALEAYKSGEVDAVTNAEFAPLALKLLSPYEDFKQTTHNALNFYEFNILNPPYNDHRVREALSMAIERERLTEGEMKGSTTPATGFLPFDDQPHARIEQDAAKAKDLLAKAGFPDGEYFPTLKLVVNRNDTQQRIARSVAKMWKDNLNIDTEIIVKDPAAFEEAKASGDFDLIRRGLVFPTMDSTASFMAIFPPAEHEVSGHQPLPNENTSNTEAEHARAKMPEAASEPLTLTEEDAVLNLLAIPLYYPTSYSLVKPYVQGFEVNGLDAPSLKEVAIDNDWQPGK